MKSSEWRYKKIEDQPVSYEGNNEKRGYGGYSSRRGKAKRQEISSRFQNSENQEESDRILEELFNKLFNPEFDLLLQNQDF